MAEMMMLDAASTGAPSKAGTQATAQRGAGEGVFALNLADALADGPAESVLQQLFAMEGQAAPEGAATADAAVALENLAAGTSMRALVKMLQQAAAELRRGGASGESEKGEALDEVAAMLAALLKTQPPQTVAVDADAEAQAVPPTTDAAQGGSRQAPPSGQPAAGGQGLPADAFANMVERMASGSEAAGAQASPAPTAASAQTVADATAAHALKQGSLGSVEATSVDKAPAVAQAAQAGAAQDAPKAPEVSATSATAQAAPMAAKSDTDALRAKVEAVVAGKALETGGSHNAAESKAADAPAPQSAPRVDQERLISRIAQAATQAQHGERSTVRVRLYPPELGTVRVEVTSVRGNVSVRIETSTPEAQGAINSNLAALRTQLADSGVQARDVTVNYRSPSLGLGVSHDQAGRGGSQYQPRRQEERRRESEPADEAAPAMTAASGNVSGTLDLMV